MAGELIPCLQDVVECCLCLEVMRRPKALQCLHSFCQPCLQTYCHAAAECASDAGNMDCIVCPICRKETPLGSRKIDGLPDDFKVSKIRDILNGHSKESSEETANNKEFGDIPPETDAQRRRRERIKERELILSQCENRASVEMNAFDQVDSYRRRTPNNTLHGITYRPSEFNIFQGRNRGSLMDRINRFAP